MRHSDASALLVNETIKNLDRVVDEQKWVIDKLKAERERAPGTYRIEAADIRQIALAIREIEAGDNFGLRRLEDVMETLRPDWREWI